MTIDLEQFPYLQDLNKAQQEAVTYTDGPSLVIAGAGSGKTRVLVYKLIHLLHLGYAPYKLMALTFTNKAAREMRQRIELIDPKAAKQIRMGTFHSIFLRILRSYPELLGYAPNFSVWDATDVKNRIKQIIKDLALDDKVYKPNLVYSRISSAKNRLLSPEAYRGDAEAMQRDIRGGVGRIADIYLRYSWELRQSNAMDFDDLLYQMNILFRDYPEVLAEWQERIDFLLIDEYQDTNQAQYMIARRLMGEKGKICVVGDDAQSIYSFRGANIENILNFRRNFPNARLFKLEQNYRSTQIIVQAANALIAHNTNQIPKEIYSLEGVGERLSLYEAYSGEGEAQWVVREIDKRRIQTGCGYDSFAVLYRTNAQSRTLEQTFRQRGIPFRIHGGRSFYDHKEIKDVLSYFRLIINPTDEEALLRIINYPKRGIGDTSIDKVVSVARLGGRPLIEVLHNPVVFGVKVNKGTENKLKDFAQLIDRMREISQGEESLYEIAHQITGLSGIPGELMRDLTEENKERERNVQELLVSIDEYERNRIDEGEDRPTLASFVGEVALLTDREEDEDGEARVTLMTVHSSKGLEFEHVFIVGLEEQLFPSGMSYEVEEVEEERRLMYVALTRAEKSCSLSYARERFRNGRMEMVRPSRFIRELPPELLQPNRAAQEAMQMQTLWRGNSYSSRRREVEVPQKFTTTSRSFLPDAPEGTKRVHIGRRVAGVDEPTKHERIGQLKVGGRVRHQRFGEGEVLELEGEGDQAKVRVVFDSGDTKMLLIRFAQLQNLSD